MLDDFQLIAEDAPEAAPTPDPTLTFTYSDLSFTRPESRRERALRAHAAAMAARDAATTPSLLD